MNHRRRMVAWMLSAAMLLGPLTARAEEMPAAPPQEASPGEALPTGKPTNEPTEAPTIEPTDEPAGEPTDEPAGEPTTEPTGEPTTEPTGEPTTEPTGEPTAEPTDEPAQEPTEPPEAFEPTGEAWAELEDGQRKDGRLQDVLDWIKESEQNATLYLLTRHAVTVKGIELELFESGTIQVAPDGEAFGDKAERYEVVITAGEAAEGEIPPLSIQAVSKDAEQGPTDKPTDEPTPGPTESPDGDVTPNPTGSPDAEPTDEPTSEPTSEPTPEPTSEPTPDPTPEPTPAVTLTVTAEGYHEGEWSTETPVFTLSGIEEGSQDYVYGVFICNERLILLENGMNVYVPEEQGETSLRFAILDCMGDIVALSAQYDLMVDSMPPYGPYFEQADFSDTLAWMEIYDGESGLEAISYDFGQTWEAYNPEFEPYSVNGEKGEVIEAGQILIRDRAGHVSQNEMEFTFGRKINGLLPPSTGGGKPTIKHVKETMDYSRANYNALELDFPEEPVAELVAGETTLALTLTGEADEDREPALFTARLDTWQRDAQTVLDKPNALVLSAESAQGMNRWSFTGDVYRLLYNSGIDYLVMASGEYITAIPTAGFTGGTQYAKLKASGVSTRKFAYTLCQDEALRETTMSVTVGEETYLLGEERDQPMYRYDVLVGTRDMMERPYESYKPENAAAQENGEAEPKTGS